MQIVQGGLSERVHTLWKLWDRAVRQYSDSLWAGRSGDRISVGASRTRPARLWGPPSLPYNGYRSFSQGVKRPGCGVDHPPPFGVEVKDRVELYLYSPIWVFVACSRVNCVLCCTRCTFLHDNVWTSKCLLRIWWKTVNRETRHRWKDGMDWIHLAQERNKWQAVVNTGIYLRVTHNAQQILVCCTE